jgi:two-component system, chemotaxis family, protein-glutamate methylesterase/glutaminase
VAPKKVMLVDDSNMMRFIVRTLLTTDPNLTVVSSVENGKRALEALAESQPDLIVLDLEMPQMNGLEFLRIAHTTTKAKVVVLTSFAPTGSSQRDEALRLGADAIISKPSSAISFDLDQGCGPALFTTIYRLLGMGVPARA